MRTVRTMVLSGAAAAVLAGALSAAEARSPAVHVLKVQLPDGETEQIRYMGNTLPQINFVPGAAPVAVLWPESAFFGAGSPFADIERVSAEMDHQMNVFMREAEAMARAPLANSGDVKEVWFRNAPPGSTGYSIVTTMIGNGVCTRTTRITAAADGEKPKVVSSSSGDCGAGSVGERSPMDTNVEKNRIEIRDNGVGPGPRRAPLLHAAALDRS